MKAAHPACGEAALPRLAATSGSVSVLKVILGLICEPSFGSSSGFILSGPIDWVLFMLQILWYIPSTYYLVYSSHHLLLLRASEICPRSKPRDGGIQSQTRPSDARGHARQIVTTFNRRRMCVAGWGGVVMVGKLSEILLLMPDFLVLISSCLAARSCYYHSLRAPVTGPVGTCPSFLLSAFWCWQLHWKITCWLLPCSLDTDRASCSGLPAPSVPSPPLHRGPDRPHSVCVPPCK